MRLDDGNNVGSYRTASDQANEAAESSDHWRAAPVVPVAVLPSLLLRVQAQNAGLLLCLATPCTPGRAAFPIQVLATSPEHAMALPAALAEHGQQILSCILSHSRTLLGTTPRFYCAIENELGSSQTAYSLAPAS